MGIFKANFRITDDQHELVAQAAIKAGKSIQDWLLETVVRKAEAELKKK